MKQRPTPITKVTNTFIHIFVAVALCIHLPYSTTRYQEITYTMAFTDEQKRALAIIPKCTAPLSFLGSSCVLYEVLRDRKKWSKPYHRILFSMSVVDLLTSICFGLSTRPIPSDSAGEGPSRLVKRKAL